MKKLILTRPLVACIASILFSSAACLTASAQLSTNPDKFLGNITTRYQMDAGGGVPAFYKLWNQVTCENESKWGSVENSRNNYNWGCDNAFNYAKQHKFTYKFHALVWGSQYPNWLPNLTPKDRYAAIVKWFDAVKKKYTTLPLIDVVNEAIDGHQSGNPMIKESLGGGGKTGYDWLIKAFDMAYERWPDAILIYNDFNTFQWNTDQFIDLVRTLRDAGAPIDAYGCQSHDLTNCDLSNFKSSETKIQNALKMPMYSTEYDIGTADDNLQLKRYKEQIPYMWEKDYCAGITLWGYVYGATWTTDGNSGLYKNGKERPAMTWLKEYMASDAAKNAKSPFPGMKKEASVYVRPASLKVAKGDKMAIKVHAKMATKTVEKVELYDGTKLIATMTEAPYIAEYSSTSTGTRTIKAVVTTTDGATYERLSRINVLSSTTARKPHNDVVPELPGIVEIEDYDDGAAGVSYNNASRTGVMKDNSWMEYTVDVKEEGLYSFDAEVASAKDGGSFYLAEYGLDKLDFLTEFTEVPKTGSASDYMTLHSTMLMPLTAGRHVICLNVTKGGFNIDKITFSRYEQDSKMTVSISSLKPTSVSVDEPTTITVNAKSSTSTIANVKVYANNLLIGTLTEAPYTMEFTPTELGTYTITATATDTEGRSKTSAAKTLKVNGKRVPYSSTAITIPGVIQAENYDKGGDGLTFHDADAENQGDANFRTTEAVDIVKGNGGKAVGYTSANEWIEYSVNVVDAGEYTCEATVSSGTTGSGFTLGLVKNGKVTDLCKIDVPQTGNNDWGTYKTVTATLSKELTIGEQILRITINGSNCNIDKLELKCTKSTGIEESIQSLSDSEQQQFNLSGQKVSSEYRGLIIKNGRKILIR